jgi:hypothetical protein
LGRNQVQSIVLTEITREQGVPSPLGREPTQERVPDIVKPSKGP